MEFPIEKQGLSNAENYSKDELDVAYKLAKKVHDELGEFVRAMVLFGSIARKKAPEKHIEGKVNSKKPGDIDILLVVDDVKLKLNRELVQTYRVILEKVIRETSDRLHVITLKFTSFWEYVRAGDPVAVNVLRDGVPIIDTGFFEPLQVLLRQGRIRPSPESIYSYFMKAPNTLRNSQGHVAQATVDLYWAVIDAAHAALMKVNEIPPSPEHVSEMVQKRLIKPGAVEPKYAKVPDKFYNLMKDITHGKKEPTGSEYDKLFKEASEFVKEMEKFINK